MDKLKYILLFFCSIALGQSKAVKLAIQSQGLACVHTPIDADVFGYGEICWDEVGTPVVNGSYASNTLFMDVAEGSDGHTYIQGDNKITFQVNAADPVNSPTTDYNYRDEVRFDAWDQEYALGVEWWAGWSMYMPDDYEIDETDVCVVYQMHNASSVGGRPPLVDLVLTNNSIYGGNAGEIILINNGDTSETVRFETGVKPLAGSKTDIVIHVIWGDDTDLGLLELWLNGTKVYSKVAETVHTQYSEIYGGNAKWGIYKYPWRTQSLAEAAISEGRGVFSFSIGPVKYILREETDPDIGACEVCDYDRVKPQ